MVAQFDYTEFITLARDSFEEFGREVTLQQLGAPIRTPRELPQQNIIRSVDTYGLFAAAGTQIEWEQSLANLVRRDEHGFYVPSLPSGSLSGFHIIRDNENGAETIWVIKNIEIFKPGGVEIFGFIEVAL